MTKIKYKDMDAWFEEDEKIFGHPKNPYHVCYSLFLWTSADSLSQRVDVHQSSRHVLVELDGVELANTTKPRLLFETGLRFRTYIPVTDCRIDLLVPSDLVTTCPYKVSK